jgi:hypothetical protein
MNPFIAIAAGILLAGKKKKKTVKKQEPGSKTVVIKKDTNTAIKAEILPEPAEAKKPPTPARPSEIDVPKIDLNKIENDKEIKKSNILCNTKR